MELETLKETLFNALVIQSKAVGSKSNIPVLSNVMLKAETSKLYLYSTNLEFNIITWIGADIIKSGSITVSLKRFLEYVNTLPEGNIKLEQEEGLLLINGKNSKASFNTIPSQEFPKISGIKEEPITAINSALFFDAVNFVSFSASKDETRPTFTGIYLEIASSYVEFVAIDGFRIAKRKLLVETGVSSTLSFIIPALYLEEIARMPADKEDDVKIYVIGSKNQLGLRYKDTDFIIRLIEGNYPDYTRVIPSSFETQIILKREELVDAVKVSNIFAPQKEIGRTQVQIEEDHIILKSSQKEVGGSEIRIDATVKGSVGTITYNSKFLLEAVSRLSSEDILLKVIFTQDKPSMLFNVAADAADPYAVDEGNFCLMTPIKVE